MQRRSNYLEILYLHEFYPLIDTIKEDQNSKRSAAEIEELNREKKSVKIKEGTSKLYKKSLVYE